MKVAIVYTKERLAVNEFFAKKLSEYTGGEIVDESVSDRYDLYLFRCENSILRTELEKKGKRVVNNALTGRIANDKVLSYELARRLEIPFLPFTTDAEQANFPCVAKSPYGHGGKEVFWCETREECHFVEPMIYQKPSVQRGKDVRVYCLGNEILCAMERYNEHDFRSNFTLGGTCKRTELPSRVKEYVYRILKALGPTMVGIDFIIDGDTYYFNEIEDVVGTRMLYHEGIDAAKLLSEFLLHV